MLQRILAWVLLALTFYTASSKAEIVSVPILNGQFTVNVMTGADAYQLQELKNNSAATRHNISDDANVNVPLQFTFPFFGQNFTNSWMYSNGAVSFKSGNAPSGFCCSGIDLTTERNTGYNYSLLPLQTDLIGTTNNNFYSLGTKNSMTYGWYGVNEYGNSNKSSFEVKIDSSGGVDFRFGQAFITSHPVTIGMAGDLTKGEYYQYFNGSNINRSNFGLNGTFGTAQDPCVADPLANSSCPGYAAAYLTQQCNISALYDVSCPGYATAYFNQQCGISALYNVACPGYAAAYFTQQCNVNQLYNTSCPGYAAAYLTQQCNITQLYSTSCPGYQTAYAQKVALETQTKLASAETSRNEAPKADALPPGSPPPPPPGAPIQDTTSAKADVKLDLGGATISATGEIKPADGIPDAARPPPPPEMASGPGPGPGGPSNAANPSLPPPPGAPAGFAERQESQQDRRSGPPVNALAIARNAVAATENLARAVASESAKMSFSENANPSDGIGLNLDGTGARLSIPGLSFGIQTAGSFQQEATNSNTAFNSFKSEVTSMTMASVQEQKPMARQENANTSQSMEVPLIPQQNSNTHFENKVNSITALQEQRIDNNETVKNKGDVSELAGGVDLTKLTALPTGYASYLSFAIKDSPFYDIKEVYKNQVNVDNARALRQISSDRLHQQLINLQYK